jgi:hypothetical protein
MQTAIEVAHEGFESLVSELIERQNPWPRLARRAQRWIILSGCPDGGRFQIEEIAELGQLIEPGP